MNNAQATRTAILKTVLGCAFMLGLCAPRHSGFIVLFFLIFIIPFFVRSAINCIKDPSQRKLRVTQSVIWVSGLLVVAGVHFKIHIDARQNANEIARTIEGYKIQMGRYPNSPEEAGIEEQLLRKDRIYYSRSSGEPFLMYPFTFLPFETYDYDFTAKEWRNNPS